MSGALDILQMEEEDVLKFLAAGTHLGGIDLDFQMEEYIHKRKSDGNYISSVKNLGKASSAAHAIVAIENPADVSVLLFGNTGRGAVLKFVAATGATPTASLLELSLTRSRQPSGSPDCLTQTLHYVDTAIPCNKGAPSGGLLWWMLAREVPWEAVPDLYFYRDPEEIEKEDHAAAEKAVTKEEFQGEWTAPAPDFTATQPEVAD
ncbi:hypothetical protein GH733_013633 [Mirounga leonina]|nr:hypothetical protein GH733_013633 [Mirounga leonina]